MTPASSSSVSTLVSCWWCGQSADSREHKYKKSDLTRVYGPGPYKDDEVLLRLSDGRRTEMRGPDSRVLKFEPTLCQRCNNHRSQPFDAAYDRFAKYVFSNERRVLLARRVRLSTIYGSSWRHESENLSKYFVKHICCRLAESANDPRPAINPKLVAFLDGGVPPDCLELDLYVDRTFLWMWRVLRTGGSTPTGFFSLGPLWGLIDEQGGLAEPQSSLGLGWLWIAWRVDGNAGYVNPLVRDVVRLRRVRTRPARFHWALVFGYFRSRLDPIMRRRLRS
jgi:hypothetical protein